MEWEWNIRLCQVRLSQVWEMRTATYLAIWLSSRWPRRHCRGPIFIDTTHPSISPSPSPPPSFPFLPLLPLPSLPPPPSLSIQHTTLLPRSASVPPFHKPTQHELIHPAIPPSTPPSNCHRQKPVRTECAQPPPSSPSPVSPPSLLHSTPQPSNPDKAAVLPYQTRGRLV